MQSHTSRCAASLMAWKSMWRGSRMAPMSSWIVRAVFLTLPSGAPPLPTAELEADSPDTAPRLPVTPSPVTGGRELRCVGISSDCPAGAPAGLLTAAVAVAVAVVVVAAAASARTCL